MNKTEFKDLKDEIVKRGMDINDFELNNINLVKCDPNELMLGDLVVIKRISNNKQKSYETYINGVPFIINFSDDLNKGYFN